MQRFLGCLVAVCLAGVAGCARCSRVPARRRPAADFCKQAVAHVQHIAAAANHEDPDEQTVAGVSVENAVVICEKEGLSAAQARCILAAKDINQLWAVGSCPAIREKKPGWLILPPTPKQLTTLQHLLRAPTGPRHGPLRYRQLVGSALGSCGLQSDGTMHCWGRKANVPAGRFTKIGWGWHLCGLDPQGHLHCASKVAGDDLSYLPKEALSDFAEGDDHGCGVTRRHNKVVCWSASAKNAISAPAGKFVEVVSGSGYSCARASNGTVTCFGDGAPSAAPGRFTALSSGRATVCGIRKGGALDCWGSNLDGQATPPKGTYKALSCGERHCCAIRNDGVLACWGDRDDGRSSPPAGTFQVVMAAANHSCAASAKGTVCWGRDTMGQCNVPQSATSDNWFTPGMGH